MLIFAIKLCSDALQKANWFYVYKKGISLDEFNQRGWQMAYKLLGKKILPIFLFFIPLLVSAQTALEKEAEKLYRSDDFIGALPKYEQLVNHYSKNGKFHHRLGVCLIETGTDYVKARKHLKISRGQGIRVSDMYIGKSYYMEYQFDKAIEYYTKYLKAIRSDSPNYEWTKDEIKRCQDLWSHLQRTEDVEILSREVVSYDEFYKHYKLSNESGRVVSTTDFFDDADSSMVMYVNERGDRVCYPKVLNDTLDTDLFTKNKLLDKWGVEEHLGDNINSEGNELYPYFLDDGVSLYFCSNGHGGLGGYDIFVTRYNPSSKEFLPPANLGMPFNSIGNDFLYVLDEFAGVGWFASDRNNKEGEITVYAFKPNEYKKPLKADRETLINAARLILESDSLAGYSVVTEDTTSTKPDVLNGEPIFFVLNDTIIYKSTSQFVSAAALNLYKFGEMKMKRLEKIKKDLEDNRARYASITDPEERKHISALIVGLEDEIFTLDSHTEDPFQVARNKELEVLKASGWELYRGVDYDALLDEELQNKTHLKAPEFTSNILNQKYTEVFTTDEVNLLLEYDNEMHDLEAKAGILTDAGLMFLSEESLENTTTYFWRQMRKVDTAFVYSKSHIELQKLSKENLLSIHRQWLHTKMLKCEILELRTKAYSGLVEGVEAQMAMMEYIDKGNQMSREVHHFLDSVSVDEQNMVLFTGQKSVADKCQDMYEYALQYYIEEYGGVLGATAEETPAKAPVVAAKPKLEKALQPAASSEEVKEEVLEIQKEELPALVYKVQIGIFSTPPAKNLLDQIPPVETIKFDGIAHPKYYSGKYASLDEAKLKAKEFDKIGFKGAFVVPFIDGKPVSWKEANQFGTTD